MIEKEVFSGILESIEDKLGVPIDHIIIDAKRRDAKLYVDDILSGVLGKVIRQPWLRVFGYKIMILQASYIGLAKMRLLSYKPGRRFIGVVESVYHPALFMGDVCGAFESLEGVRAKPEYGRVGDNWYMELTPSGEYPGEDRLELEKLPEVPARAGYDRCPECGVPRNIGDTLRWEPRRGKIVDKVTGKWIIYVDVEALDAILRELAKELGEEIDAQGVERSFKIYRDLKKEFPGSHLENLAFLKDRGLGVPASEDPGPDELKAGLEIRNAFNGPILAGLVAALYGGDDPDYAWDNLKPGVVRITVKS
ncbi:MAG: hypothetical protein SWK76_09535 [Actinomycetota bacterium]|nr:hypothetical protein [Actinomycetota bacterium]